MAKKEAKTDLWVARQLDDSKIKYDAQGSDVKEINDALQSASKRGTGNAGYVCCSRAKKRLFLFVTVPTDYEFKAFLMSLIGKDNIYTYSQFLEMER